MTEIVAVLGAEGVRGLSQLLQEVPVLLHRELQPMLGDDGVGDGRVGHPVIAGAQGSQNLGAQVAMAEWADSGARPDGLERPGLESDAKESDQSLDVGHGGSSRFRGHQQLLVISDLGELTPQPRMQPQ